MVWGPHHEVVGFGADRDTFSASVHMVIVIANFAPGASVHDCLAKFPARTLLAFEGLDGAHPDFCIANPVYGLRLCCVPVKGDAVEASPFERCDYRGLRGNP